MGWDIADVLQWAWTLALIAFGYVTKQIADLRKVLDAREGVINEHESRMRVTEVMTEALQTRAIEDRNLVANMVTDITRKLDRIEEKIDRKADKNE